MKKRIRSTKRVKTGRAFKIQIQPNRAKKMDLNEILALARKLALKKRLVADFSIEKGHARVPYVNLRFRSKKPKESWGFLKEKLFKHKKHGLYLKKASMVVCEGKRGWDDYLLLYHYDSKQKLDKAR